MATVNQYFSLLTITEPLNSDRLINWKSDALYPFSSADFHQKEFAKMLRYSLSCYIFTDKLEKLSLSPS